MRRPSALELFGWCALAWLAAFALLKHYGSPQYGNDGYTYVSVAENFLHGKGLKTSIVYFDAERASGSIPAPLVTFGPGYSLLTGVIAALGIPVRIATVTVSQLSFALLPLALVFSFPAGMGRLSMRVMLLLLAFNSALLELSSAVVSDALFTFMTALVILCFSRAIDCEEFGTGARWQLLGWVLIGCSYWVRYAGLFVFAGALTFFGLQALIRRDRRAWLDVLMSAAAGVLIAASMLRNYVLAGSWRGGVAKAAADAGRWSPRPLAVAMYHLLLGRIKVEPSIAMGLVVVGLAGLIFLGVKLHGSKVRRGFGAREWLLVSIICVYIAALVYADRTMLISFGTRYLNVLFFPIVLLFGVWLNGLEARSRSVLAPALFCSLLAAGYLWLNIRALGEVPDVRHWDVEKAFAQPAAGGGNLNDWAAKNLMPGETITATDGQATLFVLGHPTRCITDTEFTAREWTREILLAEMRLYKARYLILYPGLAKDVASAQDLPLFREMLAGKIPEGFELAARNDAVMIFKRRLI